MNMQHDPRARALVCVAPFALALADRGEDAHAPGQHAAAEIPRDSDAVQLNRGEHKTPAGEGTGMKRLALALVLFLWLPAAPAGAQSGEADAALTLEAAVRLGLERDASGARRAALARGLEHEAVAEAQLPDPKFRVGALNLPTDSFALDREPMTQIQFGLQQAFPSRTARESRARRLGALSRAEWAQVDEQALAVALAVRRGWLEAFYWDRARRIVLRNQGLFEQLVSITRSAYGVGKGDQQDVLEAELELERLRDQLTLIASREATARAELARWVGAPALHQALARTLPQLPPPPEPEVLRGRLDNHPALEREASQIEAGLAEVDEARAAYRPTWALDVSYGVRQGFDPSGAERPDFASVILSFDLPLFPNRRQDQSLASARESLTAARLSREDRLRELRRQMEAAHAQWRRLAERVDLYEHDLTPAARRNAQAALSAYRSGTTEFTALMRAYITALETQLQAEQLRVEHAQTQAELLYLAGERS